MQSAPPPLTYQVDIALYDAKSGSRLKQVPLVNMASVWLRHVEYEGVVACSAAALAVAEPRKRIFLRGARS